MRFDHFELLPTHSGMDATDALRFVNWFFANRTRIQLEFPYDDSARSHARQTTPVCVLYFPAILASGRDAARDYCVEQTNLLLLALALSRDAGGTVFDVVLVAEGSGEAVKYEISAPYVGNLLLGDLSGESFEAVHSYLVGINSNATNRFLVNLYKEARRERSLDFQYVRYWQILETMAESRNYDSAAILLDFDGDPMSDDGGQQRRVSGSVNTVFQLLRENHIGDTAETWKHVNIWFAFRNAVAHHGAVSQYAALSRESVREWARLGYEDPQRTPHHDVFLWLLKENVKLLLMRQLVQTAQNRQSRSAGQAPPGATT